MNLKSMNNYHGHNGKRKTVFQQLILIHWWMASLYLALIIGGMLMERWPAGFPFRQALYTSHKSIGILTIGLLVWRVFILIQVWIRKYGRRFPKLTAHWLKKTILHSLLYIFMVITPATGYSFLTHFGQRVLDFLVSLFPIYFLPIRL